MEEVKYESKRKRHQCYWDNGESGHEKQSAYVMSDDEEYALDVSSDIYEYETSICVPIKYCPFCGQKLE